MSEFSGKTTYLAGILRPDGKAVMDDPAHRATWIIDRSLEIAGYESDGGEDDYSLTTAKRGADLLTDELIDRGVALDAATHTAVIFTIVTSVKVEAAS